MCVVRTCRWFCSPALWVWDDGQCEAEAASYEPGEISVRTLRAMLESLDCILRAVYQEPLRSLKQESDMVHVTFWCTRKCTREERNWKLGT